MDVAIVMLVSVYVEELFLKFNNFSFLVDFAKEYDDIVNKILVFQVTSVV